MGLSYSRGLAAALGIPCLGVNHIEAHLWSAQLTHPEMQPPFLALIVSGGHTLLVQVDGLRNYEVLGRTRDDAVGEAYDKVGKLLGMDYPAGAVIDGLARSGDPEFHPFVQPGPKGKNVGFQLQRTEDGSPCITCRP